MGKYRILNYFGKFIVAIAGEVNETRATGEFTSETKVIRIEWQRLKYPWHTETYFETIEAAEQFIKEHSELHTVVKEIDGNK